MKYQRRPNDAHNLPELKTFRMELRSSLTPAEAAFWNIVKNSQLDGKKFRRQHSVDRYILDFYCPSERLGIEFDGQSHFNVLANIYDQERTWFLESFRIKIIRFENKAIFENEIGSFIRSEVVMVGKKEKRRRSSDQFLFFCLHVE